LTPLAGIEGRRVATIEGVIASGDATAAAVQAAWLEADVPQCGWCQVGQVMAAIDLVKQKPDPSDGDIAAITNLCRCGTYPRIREAIKSAARAATRSGAKSDARGGA
jgi:isoquinoline 1-oxidoreductase alpha subunit